MGDLFPITRVCCRCGGHNIVRAKRRIANGTYQVYDHCNTCNGNANKSTIISHSRAGDLALLELKGDYKKGMPPCDVCGSGEGVEMHHWAPREMFEDAEQWPMGFLCLNCHTKWHKIINQKRYEQEFAY